jgi:hypothetical protein
MYVYIPVPRELSLMVRQRRNRALRRVNKRELVGNEERGSCRLIKIRLPGGQVIMSCISI